MAIVSFRNIKLHNAHPVVQAMRTPISSLKFLIESPLSINGIFMRNVELRPQASCSPQSSREGFSGRRRELSESGSASSSQSMTEDRTVRFDRTPDTVINPEDVDMQRRSSQLRHRQSPRRRRRCPTPFVHRRRRDKKENTSGRVKNDNDDDDDGDENENENENEQGNENNNETSKNSTSPGTESASTSISSILDPKNVASPVTFSSTAVHTTPIKADICEFTNSQHSQQLNQAASSRLSDFSNNQDSGTSGYVIGDSSDDGTSVSESTPNATLIGLSKTIAVTDNEDYQCDTEVENPRHRIKVNEALKIQSVQVENDKNVEKKAEIDDKTPKLSVENVIEAEGKEIKTEKQFSKKSKEPAIENVPASPVNNQDKNNPKTETIMKEENAYEQKSIADPARETSRKTGSSKRSVSAIEVSKDVKSPSRKSSSLRIKSKSGREDNDNNRGGRPIEKMVSFAVPDDEHSSPIRRVPTRRTRRDVTPFSPRVPIIVSDDDSDESEDSTLAHRRALMERIRNRDCN